MTNSGIDLEEFDTGTDATARPSADYLRGVRDTEASTSVRAAEKQAEALAQVSATLSDMAFGFAEAEEHLLQVLKHLLRQVAEAALPQVVLESFGAHFQEAMATVFSDAASAPVSIGVHPQLVEELDSTLSDVARSRFEFVPDTNLLPGQAVLRGPDLSFAIDLPALTENLQKALAGLDTPERSLSHG